MRLRTVCTAGLGAAALVLSTLSMGTATAATDLVSPSGIAAKASGVSGVSGVQGSTAVAQATPTRLGKCATDFGPRLETEDGLIAWNDGSQYDTAGGADVVCKGKKRKRKINEVQAWGYFGASAETFHVTFYRDSTAGGSSEPDDSNMICDYPALTGNAGGPYPGGALSKIPLDSTCLLPKGVSWLSIQNVNPSGPWYWEMQSTVGGNTIADWVDRTDAFGSGCTTFDNNKYLVDCLGFPYPDFRFKLK